MTKDKLCEVYKERKAKYDGLLTAYESILKGNGKQMADMLFGDDLSDAKDRLESLRVELGKHGMVG